MNFVLDTIVLDYDQRMARRYILSAIIKEISIFIKIEIPLSILIFMFIVNNEIYVLVIVLI